MDLIVTIYILMASGQTMIDRQPPRQVRAESCAEAARAIERDATRDGVRVVAFCAPRQQ